MDRLVQAQAIVASIDAMLTFSDQQEDYILAAKLEDVRQHFVNRYLPED